MSTILIIDDELPIIDSLTFVLDINGYEVLSAQSGDTGILVFKENIDIIDTVITDIKMPKMSGMEVLKQIKSIYPEMSVIVLTGHGDMESAILALKDGAYEYLLKPVNADNLSIALRNAVDYKRQLIKNKLMQEEIKKSNDFLKSIHESAQRLLINMIPEKLPNIQNVKFAPIYKACEDVGGDMFDVVEMEDKYLFYIFDVSSHGVLASLISIILKSFIPNIKYTLDKNFSSEQLAYFISELNNSLYINRGKNNFYATLFIASIDKNTKKMTYISAGHIPQFLFNENEIIKLESTGTILGTFEDITFDTKEIQLKSKDKILLFTDGVTEISSPTELFGSKRLEDFIELNKHTEITTVVNNLMSEITNFSNNNFSDDTTILGIEFL